jgi:hypothetical protein
MNEQMELLHADHIDELLASGKQRIYVLEELTTIYSMALDIVRAEGYEERENAVSSLESFLR